MPIYRLSSHAIEALPETSFADRGVRERSDLQRLLKANIAVVAPDVLVISEEFGEDRKWGGPEMGISPISKLDGDILH